MIDENRIIVNEGLNNYQRGVEFGVDAIIDVTKIDAHNLSTQDIGFTL